MFWVLGTQPQLILIALFIANSANLNSQQGYEDDVQNITETLRFKTAT